MINPILSRIDQNGSTNGIMGMLNAVRNSKNPNEMIAQLAMRNPQMQSVMQEVQRNGGDARKAFYAMAQQKGIDPNSILNMLK